ncbi:MAG: SpoIID/LytB domain-containing protein [Bacteroidales bacterium]|jgi:peptidoglycan hydrolase-like amidase|nr:SpoIID/LytB domain-containing protein [Bacteroidales bacterium]
MQQPKIQVGISATPALTFRLDGDFRLDDDIVTGAFTAVCEDGIIALRGKGKYQNEFTFVPATGDESFLLENVTIGIGFHWEQQERQRFTGALKLVPEGDAVRAINIVEVEEYLRSVISSEMNSLSSVELLKAHAVISRSWLLAQIAGRGKKNTPELRTNEELVKWYDREDHTLFDVCADDHCQRYQGVTKIISPQVGQAVDATFGQVLYEGDAICDARFSKCCGGISENFELVWEPTPHPGLSAIRDWIEPTMPDAPIPDLRDETAARKWILGRPPSFCNTASDDVLTQILPSFDRATTDFFRWSEQYTQYELAAIIAAKSGIEFGRIRRLEPLQRGHSGRISRLRIVGEHRTYIVGKELEIRRWLSKTHLYSSAFTVEHDGESADGFPKHFILKGAGWGHGVGLCQIGAAVMAHQGYSYTEILAHYFKNTTLQQLYAQNG